MKADIRRDSGGMNSDIKTRFHAHKRVLLTGASALTETHVRLLPDVKPTESCPVPLFSSPQIT